MGLFTGKMPEKGYIYMIKSYEEFRNQIIDYLRELCGPEYTISEMSVVKNNSVRLYGVSIARKGLTVSPLVYLEAAYRDYRRGNFDLAGAANKVLSIYRSSIIERPSELDFFEDYKRIRKRLIFKLINFNKNRDFLKGVPHRKYLDLAVIYSVSIAGKHMPQAGICVKNEHMEMWGVNEDDLFKDAEKNTPRMLRANIRSMASVLTDIISDPEESHELENDALMESGSNMYVASNEACVNGASVILYPGFLHEAADETGSDFYLLPSSIHEFIFVPAREEEALSVSELEELVKGVNASVVQPDEILSDSVYYYDRSDDRVRLAVAS